MDLPYLRLGLDCARVLALSGNAGTSLSAKLQPAELVLHPYAASPWGQYVVVRIVVFGVLFSGIASALLSEIVPQAIIWSPLVVGLML